MCEVLANACFLCENFINGSFNIGNPLDIVKVREYIITAILDRYRNRIILTINFPAILSICVWL